jgi:SAM-dependent methyltransferase
MSEPDDPYSWRRPTSHELLSGRPWDASYHDGPAPWDTGRPQPAVVRLAGDGAFRGRVLDVGCGTGSNAIQIAATSRLPVVGVDVAETALTVAREKAVASDVDAEFIVADALQLAGLGSVFDTVLDCGLFHTFAEDERAVYVQNLAAVTTSGGTVYVLCFSDQEPGSGGPHRISQRELAQPFTAQRGWKLRSIQPERFETRFGPEGAAAWLAQAERTDG